MCKTLHKMRVREEEGDLWFNKSCHSNLIATTVKKGQKKLVYMYLGGGGVDYEQSPLLQGIVVVCKAWRWAAFAYAAVRLAGLACGNCIGPLRDTLMLHQDELETAKEMKSHTSEEPQLDELCRSLWSRTCEIWSCASEAVPLEKLEELTSNKHERSKQSVSFTAHMKLVLETFEEDVNKEAATW